MANPKSPVSSLSTHWDTLGICGLCDRGVLVVFENSTKEFYGGAFDDFLTANPRLIGVFPSSPSFSAPGHTPLRLAFLVLGVALTANTLAVIGPAPYFGHGSISCAQTSEHPQGLDQWRGFFVQ